MPTLEDAIALALEGHRGQRDKAGAPYILHPLRVMLAVDGDTERMAAVLHDVVEDTGTTLEALREAGYPDDVLAIVERITHRDGESYDAFVERVAASPAAARVKLADIEDNLSVKRLDQVTERDAARLTKYLKARARLRAALRLDA